MIVQDYDTSELRAEVLRAWEAWDDAPSNDARVRDFAAATTAYVGIDMTLQFRRFILQAIHDGASRAQAIDAWEADW